jgi:tRNA pseudouridine55 synthase
VVETTEVREIDKQELKRVLRGFEGGYIQKVPRYAAVKVKGTRMYKLAREGKQIKQPKRKVKIREIELIKFKVTNLKELRVRVVCGSGTYMRQLAVDIGEKLGLAAHAKELRRVRVGKYLLK